MNYLLKVMVSLTQELHALGLLQKQLGLNPARNLLRHLWIDTRYPPPNGCLLLMLIKQLNSSMSKASNCNMSERSIDTKRNRM